MTGHGNKLSGLSVEVVTDRLGVETDGKAVKRLVAAREYFAGNSPAEISEKYGWPEQTIYSWFDRLENRDLEDALYDESPPGRPATLADAEFDQFRYALEASPDRSGFDAHVWSSALAQEFLQREFDYEFSRRHVRRLMRVAGRDE